MYDSLFELLDFMWHTLIRLDISELLGYKLSNRHKRTKILFLDFVRIFPLDYARRYKNQVRTINAWNMLKTLAEQL